VLRDDVDLDHWATKHAATLGRDVTLKRFADLVRRELAMEIWSE